MRPRRRQGGPERGARLSGLLLVACVLPALGACGREDGEHFGNTVRAGRGPATFYINNGSEPEYLDPGKANDTASSALIQQLFEGLTVYGPGDLRPTQGVAERWDQSADNRHFRFHLRESARWSDGKPVTAHDFEYAWKRALRPSLASLAAPHVYPLLNAELYNQGKLRVAAEGAVLRASPDAGAAGKPLPAGTLLRVLARSPRKVATAIAPLPEPPPVKAVDLVRADPRAKTAESLAFGPDAAGKIRPAASPDPAGGILGREVTLVAQAAPVECNGAPDHWYELRAPGLARGFLPGCALESTGGPTFALVAAHRKLPTFTPKPAAAEGEAEPPPEPAPLGFVDEASLGDAAGAVGVRAVSDRVLEVELEHPTPYFTDLTSTPTLFPVRRDVVEPFEQRGEPELWTRPEHLVSNGPYVLTEWKFRYEMTMEKNPHYWARDTVPLQKIVSMMVDQAHSVMNLYKAGDLDYIGDNTALPSEYLSVLSKYKDYQSFDSLSTYWYEFNTRKPPVNDVRVRRALNLAIDKQAIVEKITRGGQKPATHYVPEHTGLGYAEAVKADKAAGKDPFSSPDYVFNPDKARALLAEAGFPVTGQGGELKAQNFPPLEILYNTSEGHRQIAVTVQDMWKRHLGISVTLRNEEWKVMLKNMRDGHFHVVRMGWVADYNHPQTWLDTFVSTSPQNRTGWASAEFDALVDKAAKTPDAKESIRLFRQAEKIAVDGMPKLPIYFYTRSTLVKPYVGGFVPNGRNITLMRWLAIDPDWKKKGRAESPFVPLEFPPPGAY